MDFRKFFFILEFVWGILYGKYVFLILGIFMGILVGVRVRFYVLIFYSRGNERVLFLFSIYRKFRVFCFSFKILVLMLRSSLGWRGLSRRR